MATLSATLGKPAGQPKSKIKTGRIIAWISLIIFALITILPLYWVLRTSLTKPRDVYAYATDVIPRDPTMDNFERVLGLMSTEDAIKAGGSGQKINFLFSLRNSFIVAALLTAGQLFFSSLAAYAFARLKFPFREKLFFVYLTALMIPGVVLLIPNYVFVKDLGWLGTFQGIVAPGFLMSPFAVFFMRQFFLTLNKELEEAATLDGVSKFGLFWRVGLPLTRAPLITLGILTFIGSLNDYLWPLLAGRNEEVRTLSVALGIFRQQTPQGAPDWSGLMAGTLLAVVPALLILIILGRRVVDSIQFSGFK